MPKVRLTRNLGGQLRNQVGGECKDGEVIDATRQVADYLVAKGLGVILSDSKQEQEKHMPAAVETKPAVSESKIETRPSKGSK